MDTTYFDGLVTHMFLDSNGTNPLSSVETVIVTVSQLQVKLTIVLSYKAVTTVANKKHPIA